MVFGVTVQDPTGLGNLLAARRARVAVVRRDPFGAFVRAALRVRPRRITLVSPWLSENAHDGDISRLVTHAVRHHAGLVLVTRPPVSTVHATLTEHVRRAPRAQVYINPRLHAKLYVCETVGRRSVAVVGSANSTLGSRGLDEVGLLVMPDRDSTIIGELAGQTVRALTDGRPSSR